MKNRPKTMLGCTVRIKTACGDLFVTINRDEEGNLFELFCTMGKAGGCESALTETISRLVSLGLRSNIPVKAIVKQMVEIKCGKPYGTGDRQIDSCMDGIAKQLTLADKEVKKK